MRAPQPIALVAGALAFAALAFAPAATAHEGNPNFLSQVREITPASSGVTVEVLNRDDRLLLHNTSGEDVLVLGYDEEPYARVLADGTVQVNTDSEAQYLNDDRFANVEVPAGVDGKGAPRWRTVGRNGRFEWHDHRAHWMAEGRPPQVRDPDVETKVFDWEVPIEVGGRRGAITGTLLWTPLPGGGPPLGAILGGAAVLIACLALVAVVRYRRRAAGGGRAAAEGEAW